MVDHAPLALRHRERRRIEPKTGISMVRDEWQLTKGRSILARFDTELKAKREYNRRIGKLNKELEAYEQEREAVVSNGDWRDRANKLESDLMWSGAAMDVALTYLKAGRVEEAKMTLASRIAYVKEQLELAAEASP